MPQPLRPYLPSVEIFASLMDHLISTEKASLEQTPWGSTVHYRTSRLTSLLSLKENLLMLAEIEETEQDAYKEFHAYLVYMKEIIKTETLTNSHDGEDDSDAVSATKGKIWAHDTIFTHLTGSFHMVA